MRILLAGGSGFLGRTLSVRLRAMGHEVLVPSSKEFDFTKLEDCLKATKGVDMLINAAGVATSRTHQLNHPAGIFYANTLIALQLLEASRRNAVSKVLLVGSIRGYPEHPAPLKEEYLFGAESPVIKGAYGFYGLSKWQMIPAGRAYAEEYKDMHIKAAVFSNLYGPDDKFNMEDPPLVASLIKKIAEATWSGAPALDLGKNPGVNIDLLYIDDACDLLMKQVEDFEAGPFGVINGGSGRSYEIKEVVEIISNAFGFGGTITWSGKEGTSPYFLDITKAGRFGWKPAVSLGEGLKRSVDWYTKHHGKK